MRQKISATVVALTLAAFAAIGAFASQDKVELRSAGHLVSGGIVAAETPGVDTPTATAEASGTATETATETSTPDATSTATPEATGTPDGEEDGVHGIPDANPAHHPEDADGECEHGETHVTTTPGDTAVSVPCHAGEHGGDDDCDDDHEKDGTSTPDASATSTPVAEGTPTIAAEIPVGCDDEHSSEHHDGDSHDDHSESHGAGDSGHGDRED